LKSLSASDTILMLNPPKRYLRQAVAQLDREFEGSCILSSRHIPYDRERLAVPLRRVALGSKTPEGIFFWQMGLKLC
jgi:hypothetical protein